MPDTKPPFVLSLPFKAPDGMDLMATLTIRVDAIEVNFQHYYVPYQVEVRKFNGDVQASAIGVNNQVPRDQVPPTPLPTSNAPVDDGISPAPATIDHAARVVDALKNAHEALKAATPPSPSQAPLTPERKIVEAVDTAKEVVKAQTPAASTDAKG